MIEINKTQSKTDNEHSLRQNGMTSRNKTHLFLESKESLDLALDALVNGVTQCAVYYAYTSMILSAKAFLSTKNIYRHTHLGIANSFNIYFLETTDAVYINIFKKKFQFDSEQTISMKSAKFYVSKALAFNAQLKALKH